MKRLVTNIWPWAPVMLGAVLSVGEVAFRTTPASPASYGTAGALGMAVGGLVMLLFRLSQRRWPVALILFAMPLLWHHQRITWAVQRAGELSVWPGHVAVWGTALPLAGLGGWLCWRLVASPNGRRFWPATGALTTFLLLFPAALIALNAQHHWLDVPFAWCVLALMCAAFAAEWRNPPFAIAVALGASIALVLLRNPYHQLQIAVGWVAFAAMSMPFHLQRKTERALGRRTTLGLALATGGLLTLAHWQVATDPAVWSGVQHTRGFMSIFVRMGQQLSDWDADGHGVAFGQYDCEPLNSGAYPGNHETPGNGADDNCMLGPLEDSPGRWLADQEAMNPPPPSFAGDLVLVVVDTLRFDVSQQVFATVDENAINFTRAYAASSRTSMSMMAILGGLTPGAIPITGVEDLTAPPPGLATHLTAAGVQTAFVGGSLKEDHPLFQPESYAHGFEVRRNTSMLAHPLRVTELALETWRRLEPNRRRFLYVHYMWVHYPEDTLAGHRRRATEVADAVRQLRRGIGAEPIWVLTSDHGEEFGEHGGTRHATTLFEESVHVPLMISWPGVSGRTVEHVSPQRALMPTLLAALLPNMAAAGRGPFLCVASTECRSLPVIMEIRDQNLHLQGLLLGDRKVIHDQRRNRIVSYNLAHDPGEQQAKEGGPASLLRSLKLWQEYMMGPRQPDHFWPSYR